MSAKNFGKKGNTNGFKQKPENINRKGAPKRLISHVINEFKAKGYERMTPEQVKEVYEYLVTLPFKELAEINNNDESPLIMRILVKELTKGRGFEVIEKILDRVHGKAITKAEITGKDGKDIVTVLIVKDGDRV